MSKVAYLGPEGTFSDILARQRFGTKSPHVACQSIEAVFEKVSSGDVPAGLVPVENSSGGTVYDTVDLLIRNADRIFVREELALDIRIALLGRPGAPIRTIYSHFIQIKHHQDWLKAHHPRARLVPVESTAAAARRASETKHSAALAAPATASLYNLDVLEFPSDGQEVNVTNFFTIGLKQSASKTNARSAFVATLRNECGSLHRFLGPFARERVSLTRIVSRPIPGQPQTYVFYVEIEGNLNDPKVAHALERASRIARSLQCLGSFPVGRRFRS